MSVHGPLPRGHLEYR